MPHESQPAYVRRRQFPEPCDARTPRRSKYWGYFWPARLFQVPRPHAGRLGAGRPRPFETHLYERRTIDPPSREDTRVRLRRYNPRRGRRGCSTARIRGFACRRDCDPSVRSRRRWQRPLAPNCPDPRSRGDHRNRFRGVHSGHRLNHRRGPLNRLARHRRVSR